MTVEEGQKVIEDFRSQGRSDEEIAGAFYLLFRDDKIDVQGLEGLVNLLGFSLDDEFKQMSTEDQKKYGYEVVNEDGQDAPKQEQEPQQEPQKEEGTQEPQQEPQKEEEDNEEERGMNLLEGKNTPEKTSQDEDEEEAEARKLLKY